MFMEKSQASLNNNPDQAGLKQTSNNGHSPSFVRDTGGVKEDIQTPRRFVSSSMVFVDDLGVTLNEY